MIVRLRMRRYFVSICVCVLCGLLPATAFAERYRVDLILFLDKGGYTTELPRPFVPPDLSRALEPDPAALLGSTIDLVPDAEFGLNDQWHRLRTSRRYQPLVRLAWMQSDPVAERTMPLRVHTGLPLVLPATIAPPSAPAPTLPPGAARPAQTPAAVMQPGVANAPPVFQTVDGTIALRLSRYLFLDANLAYTQPQPDGSLVSYRLKEVRRMKRDEVHYLDSPRLGIIVKVSKAPAK